MQRIKGLISDWKEEEDKMVVRSRLLKRFKLAYKRSPVNTGNTVWRRTKVSRQFAPEVRSFERSAVGSETHDPPLRGLKTESELKIARIETQFPEGPQGFFGAWVKTQWACFRLE